MAFFKKDPLQIIAFQSYGSDTHFYTRGRALEDENINLAKRGFLTLLRNTYKRFETDPIPNAKIKFKFPDQTFLYATTDFKGYFKLDTAKANLADMANSEGWLNYELMFEDSFPDRIINNDNHFKGEMMIPSKNSSFGVISDIDDTILQTGVTSTLKWRLIFNTLFRNAESRSPLKGAAQFYHALHRGASGKEANPIFYVSHSPWNLYRYLELFLVHNEFPKGPILLRDFGALMGKKPIGEKPQKQMEIIQIMEAYPQTQFILIGDAGEHDADIYIEIATQFPNRILAIYLRNVSHRKKMLRLKNLFEEYKEVPVLLVDSSENAIKHARKHGFVS